MLNLKRLRPLKAALICAAAICLSAPAFALPAVKVIYFSATWCGNCKVLTPRLDDALTVFGPGEAQLVTVDLSKMLGGTENDRLAAVEAAEERLAAHEARYLWDWYGGFTGIAVVVSADTGEPLSCIMRLMTAGEISARIADGIFATHQLPPGARKPQGPDCPAPTRA